MGFTGIIEEFFQIPSHKELSNFFNSMYTLVQKLKEEGIKKESFDQKIVDCITNCILNDDIKEYARVKFSYYVIYYLKFLIELNYNEKQTIEFNEMITPPVNGIKIKAKDMDFPDKPCDKKWLQSIGAKIEEGE